MIGKFGRQIASSGDANPGQLEPVGQSPQFAGQRCRGWPGPACRLQMRGPHLSFTDRTIGLQVDPCAKTTGVQERQDIVTVPTPNGRNVDLKAIVEFEQPFRARPMPYQGIEGRNERRWPGRAANATLV